MEERPSCSFLLAVWGDACGAPAQRGWARGSGGDLTSLRGITDSFLRLADARTRLSPDPLKVVHILKLFPSRHDLAPGRECS